MTPPPARASLRWGSTRPGEMFTGGRRWQAQLESDRFTLWVHREPTVAVHLVQLRGVRLSTGMMWATCHFDLDDGATRTVDGIPNDHAAQMQRNLADENRFFQRVSDEAKFRVSGLTLSAALEEVGVVVLFVCSGGRQDDHPVASTTVGLPKLLLQFGSLAVIASPWPLDPRVPSHWLQDFWRLGRQAKRSSMPMPLATAVWSRKWGTTRRSEWL